MLSCRLTVLPLIVVKEIFCIVEGGSTHPFRRVRQALTGRQDITITASPWSNRYAPQMISSCPR